MFNTFNRESNKTVTVTFFFLQRKGVFIKSVEISPNIFNRHTTECTNFSLNWVKREERASKTSEGKILRNQNQI